MGSGRSGRSRDSACADRKPRNRPSNALDQRKENVARCASLHALQNRRTGMLQRHVDIFRQRRMSCNRVEQLLRHFIWIRVKKSNPLLLRRFDLPKAAEQSSQAFGTPEILAEPSRILADQADL